MADLQDWTSAAAAPQVLIDSATFNPASGPYSKTWALPRETHAVALIVLWNSTNGTAGVTASIRGHTSTFYYLKTPSTPLVGNGSVLHRLYIVPVVQAVDGSVDVVVDATDSDSTLYLAAILDVEAVMATIGAGQYGNSALNSQNTWPESAAAVIGTPAAHDVQGSNAPGTGARATITLAAQAGKRYCCCTWSACLMQTTAGSNFTFVRLRDGVSGGPNLLFNEAAGTVANAGSFARLGDAGTAWVGSVGSAMTLEWDAGTAGLAETVSLGAYLR